MQNSEVKRFNRFLWYPGSFVIGALIALLQGQMQITASPKDQNGETAHLHERGPVAAAEQSHLSDLEKLARIDLQIRFDQGLAYPDIDTTFPAFHDSWIISEALKERLGLSQTEMKIAQNLINECR